MLYKNILYESIRSGVFDNLPSDEDDVLDIVLSRLDALGYLKLIVAYSTANTIRKMMRDTRFYNNELLKDLEEILKKEKDKKYE